jgi:hypothetical protein
VIELAGISWSSPVPRLTDPEKLRCYCNALENWRYDGFIQFKPLALEELDRELNGIAQRDFRRLLHDFVQNGGEIDQVVESRNIETREEWIGDGFHYDLRPVIGGKKVYIETLLEYRDPNDPDDPVIRVVRVKPA